MPALAFPLVPARRRRTRLGGIRQDIIEADGTGGFRAIPLDRGRQRLRKQGTRGPSRISDPIHRRHGMTDLAFAGWSMADSRPASGQSKNLPGKFPMGVAIPCPRLKGPLSSREARWSRPEAMSEAATKSRVCVPSRR